MPSAAILHYRRLAVPLDEIRGLLDHGPFDAAALQRQHAREKARADAAAAALAHWEQAEALQAAGIRVPPHEWPAAFGEARPGQWVAEAAERFGAFSAWTEASKRTAEYTKDDWVRLRQEAHAVCQALGALQRAGVPADDPRAQAAAEAHRQHLDRWFYPVSRTMHARLGEMYAHDSRFQAYFDQYGPGVGDYLAAATRARAQKGAPHGQPPSV